MLIVLKNSWALLLGMLLLMIGNGLQGTLMGVRGAIEGFTTFELSLITSAYFLGFLGGSRLTPEMIRRVGHVRVFAALASFISAALILYPALTYPWAWILLRVIIGFCFCGVYVTAESWLNNAATNETRGQALSLYMIVQMAGIISAQGMLNLAAPEGFLLFIIPSVLISIAFAPILLSAVPVPAFGSNKPMSLKALYDNSPLSVVSMFFVGAIFAAQFGMSSVYATQVGLNVAQVSLFVAAIFLGAMVLQYPIGWLSDRMDRRMLILIVAAIGAVGAIIGWVIPGSFIALLAAALVVGGMANPLYALIIAYTNDYLDVEDMAAASGGLLFVNGMGAITGPIAVGWIMTVYGPSGFWLFISLMMALITAYAAWRMTRRPSAYNQDDDYDSVPYAPLGMGSTPVALEAAQEFYAEAAEEIAAESEASTAPS